jgi:hypothetical protein
VLAANCIETLQHRSFGSLREKRELEGALGLLMLCDGTRVKIIRFSP